VRVWLGDPDALFPWPLLAAVTASAAARSGDAGREGEPERGEAVAAAAAACAASNWGGVLALARPPA
jgi:hypothetical protein